MKLKNLLIGALMTVIAAPAVAQDLSADDAQKQATELIKAKNLTEARRLIVEKGYADVDVYKFLYDKYVPLCAKKGSAILTIAQYEGIGATSRLPDIQVAACLISLMGLE